MYEMNKMNERLKSLSDCQQERVQAKIVALSDESKRLGDKDLERKMNDALCYVDIAKDFYDRVIFDQHYLVYKTGIDKIRKIPIIGKMIMKSLGLI